MRNLLLATTCACLLGILTAACGGDDSREPSPSQSAGGPRLVWDQYAPSAEGPRRYSFVLYVDGSPVPLPAATCGALAAETRSAECTSPLPAMTPGQHTLEMATRVTEDGVVLESAKSASITYAAGSSSAASVTQGARVFGATAAIAAPGPRSASLRLETVVSTADGTAYAVDIVAAGAKGPAQLAWAADGRLFVAEAGGRVRVIRSNERETGARERGDSDDGDRDAGNLALDARALLDPPPVGPMGIALHPGFARNHLVYLAILAQDSPERATLRVVRLREVDSTFGEAATLFEAPLVVDAANGDWGEDAGPRLAFGPDGLLYVALPPGARFDREPTSSTPHGSMLRLRDDGRVPLDLPAIEGVPASPIGFDWHPTTGALWGVFPGDGGDAVLRPLAASGASEDAEAGRATLRSAAGGGREAGGDRTAPGVLRFERWPESRERAPRAFVAFPGLVALAAVSLGEPTRVEHLLGGMIGPISDLAAGGEGALYLAARGGEIVLLTPRSR